MPSNAQTALKPVLRDIHAWWFGPLAARTDRNADKTEIWFNVSETTDAHIRHTWGEAIPRAMAIDWDLDDLTREEQVGLVILLDQFPRNIHRESGEAFACDAKAREIATALLADGLDSFHLVEQSFVCLPFQHSEDIGDQDLAVLLFARMAVDAPSDWKDSMRVGLDYATRHRDLIRRFGRYPHRNAMLGRESTEEERKFLAEHGRGY